MSPQPGSEGFSEAYLLTLATPTQDLGSSGADILSRRECAHSSVGYCDDGMKGKGNRCKVFLAQQSLCRKRTIFPRRWEQGALMDLQASF